MGRAYEVRKASIQKTGAAKGKLYTTFAKEIYLAAKKGSPNPDANVVLKRLIDNNINYKKIYNIALHLEGLPRNIGIHASGIVMSRINLDETIPLYKNARGIYTTAYSMNYLEPLGLLKMDFLGISNLTLIAEVINNIRKNE